MLADFHGTARLPPAIGLRPHGPPSAGGYLPIAGHGVIGDLGTAALVGSEGTIDWYCPLRFDAPSIFGAILEECTPQERRAMLAKHPLPVRLLLRTVGALQYRRYVRRVRGS